MAEWKEEEWELYNDGVLVYKRKKRRFAVSQPPPPPPPPSEPQPDPEAEEKNRRARKRRALIKLKDKYQKELDQWDNLSNTLHALEERAQQQQTLRLQEQEQEREEEEDQALSAASPSGSSLVQRSMVDELLLKVEAEESIIRDVSNLCDISEALCDAQEEQLNQSLFDLPIWGSPRTLMASLCDGLED